MKYVICYPNSKVPVGSDWAAHPIDAAEVKRRLTNNPRACVGLLLGPVSGAIDIDIDSPEAEAAYARLFAGIKTPCWGSARGGHYLYEYDPRLADLPAVVHYDGLEVRLGNEKAAHSLCPPSVCDEVTRKWIISPDDCPLAKLPESIIQGLLTLPPAAQRHRQSTPIPAARQGTVDKLLRYLKRHRINVLAVREDHHGLVFIDLEHCPFSPANSERGAPAIIVFQDGGHCIKCFHPQHADKYWYDVEQAFGPLYPRVVVGTKVHRTVAESIAALTDEPTVYQHGALVEIVRDPPRPKKALVTNGAPQFRPISVHGLLPKLTANAHFGKYDMHGDWIPCSPPDKVVKGVLASPDYPGIPPALTIVSAPILRCDGSVARDPGYDVDTGLYLDIMSRFPDLMDPQEAIDLLSEVICDFPFAGPAHRSAWFSALLSLVCRAAIPGSIPMHLFDANRSRVGKGLATDAITWIAEGRKAARCTVPKHGDEEFRKLITSIAIAGAPYVCFDNIKGRFGGPVIEALLTAGRWADRILGASKTIDIPFCPFVFGTANNARLTSDMIGRIVWCRLETTLENPGARTGFKHEDLLGFIDANRPKLAMAVLSIPAAYIKAGCPDQKLRPWGGFEGWSNLVRGSLVWAGLTDPDTREDLEAQADEETPLLRQLLAAWAEFDEPITVGEAFRRADIYTDGDMLLRGVLDELSGDKKLALGNLLKTFKGRILDGKRLMRTSTARPKWFVEVVNAS